MTKNWFDNKIDRITGLTYGYYKFYVIARYPTAWSRSTWPIKNESNIQLFYKYKHKICISPSVDEWVTFSEQDLPTEEESQTLGKMRSWSYSAWKSAYLEVLKIKKDNEL